MELRTLRSFIVVAEERHVTRAARRLRVAQPALSQQIRQLERDIGVELLDRSKRAIRLTPAGEVLHAEARKVLEAAAAARDAVERAARGEVGQIVIGFGPATRSLLPAAVRSFRARTPGVDVVLREVDPRAQVGALLAGRTHVGLTHDTVDTSPVESEVLRRERFVLALPADHRLASRRAIPLKELRGERFIVPGRLSDDPLSEGVSFNQVVLAECAKVGVVPRVARRAPDLETRLVLVASGLGVSLVLERARPPRAHGVVFRPLAGPPLTLDLLAIWRRGSDASAVTAFREALRDAARPSENA